MIKKQNKKWTKKEIILIINYRKAKIKYKIIADIFNVTINSIYKTLKRYYLIKNEKIPTDSNSFLSAIKWFNNKFPNNKIIYNKLDFNFILNKELYSKISILLILNKLLFKYNLRLINDDKFIKNIYMNKLKILFLLNFIPINGNYQLIHKKLFIGSITVGFCSIGYLIYKISKKPEDLDGKNNENKFYNIKKFLTDNKEENEKLLDISIEIDKDIGIIRKNIDLYKLPVIEEKTLRNYLIGMENITKEIKENFSNVEDNFLFILVRWFNNDCLIKKNKKNQWEYHNSILNTPYKDIKDFTNLKNICVNLEKIINNLINRNIIKIINFKKDYQLIINTKFN